VYSRCFLSKVGRTHSFKSLSWWWQRGLLFSRDMRIFLSIALLLALLTTIAVCSWIWRKKLMVIFGIAPPQDASQKADLEAQEADFKGAAIEPRSMEIGAKADRQKPANRPPDRQAPGASGGFSGAPAGSSLGSGAAAPMIVVAANDANRGASLPYDALERACGN